MVDYLNDIVDKYVRPYPPPVPDSKYIRTYTLQNSWQVTPSDTPGGINVYVQSDAVDDSGSHYTNYVMGPDQVGYHALHGWRKISTIITPAIRRELQKRLQEMYKRHSDAV